jgi:hypothetical protein
MLSSHITLPCFFAHNPARDADTGLSVDCEVTESLSFLLTSLVQVARRHEVAVSALPVAAIYSHNGVVIHAEGSQLHVNQRYAWFSARWKNLDIVSEPVDLETLGVGG